ncbi:MAG TPA: chemotaxis protein CheW, partial [Thermomicrobiales bacterium]|nr:chemotaxis protein CheW [Thermomicrobiales bacterium]
MVAEAVAAPAPALGLAEPPALAAQDAARRLYLTCVLQGIGYLLPGEDVREVEALGALTPVPHTLPWLRGVMNLRGAVVPVVDLARFLGFAREAG